jgi:hypothetical protein
MLFPSIHINISRSVIAFYGAILATITATIQIKNYLRDKVRVRLSVQRDMGVFGDPDCEHMTFVMVHVANAGRRPVTITGVGAFCLYPAQCGAFLDVMPRPPCELTEGQYLLTKINQEGLEFSTIEYWYATDALGRSHKLPFAPWYRRCPVGLGGCIWRKSPAFQRVGSSLVSS